MTANELIDKLKSVSIKLLGKETEQAGKAIILYRESAIMLRQQQDEIETLKAEIIMQNERWKKIHPKESELEKKYSDEWWKGVDLLNRSFPFGWWK